MNRKFMKEEITRRAEDALRETKDLDTYKQAMAVILLNDYGFSIQEAAELMQCSHATISRLRNRFAKGEMTKKPRNGNNSYFSLEEEREIIREFEEQARSGTITNVSSIKEAYTKRLGHDVANSTIYRMLKRHGWRKVSPRPRHPQADKEAQEAFKKTSPNSCLKSRKRRKDEKFVSCFATSQVSA